MLAAMLRIGNPRSWAILLFAFVTSLHAHSLHQSTAEAEYNPTTKKLEVSLTVFINDLELALIRQCEREMRLDKTPAAEFDAQIQAYLTKTFVVTDAAGKTAKIEWVGRELDIQSAKSAEPLVTLFFEVPLPAGLTDTTLRHRVFSDLFKDQVHLLHLRSDLSEVELRFTKNETLKVLAHREQSSNSRHKKGREFESRPFEGVCYLASAEMSFLPSSTLSTRPYSAAWAADM
jgi:hypothetical protein